MSEYGVLQLAVMIVAVVGAEGAPSGHLYAHLCGRCDLDTFERAVECAVRMGMLTREPNHHLRATERGLRVASKVRATEAA